jgi:hypothetical protein
MLQMTVPSTVQQPTVLHDARQLPVSTQQLLRVGGIAGLVRDAMQRPVTMSAHRAAAAQGNSCSAMVVVVSEACAQMRYTPPAPPSDGGGGAAAPSDSGGSTASAIDLEAPPVPAAPAPPALDPTVMANLERLTKFLCGNRVPAALTQVYKVSAALHDERTSVTATQAVRLAVEAAAARRGALYVAEVLFGCLPAAQPPVPAVLETAGVTVDLTAAAMDVQDAAATSAPAPPAEDSGARGAASDPMVGGEDDGVISKDAGGDQRLTTEN